MLLDVQKDKATTSLRSVFVICWTARKKTQYLVNTEIR